MQQLPNNGVIMGAEALADLDLEQLGLDNLEDLGVLQIFNGDHDMDQQPPQPQPQAEPQQPQQVSE